MSIAPDDIRAQLRAMREDLSKLQGRVTDISNMLNELDLPKGEDHRCPQCGVRLRGPLSLAEHVYNTHGGELPQHYVEAESRAVWDAAERSDYQVQVADPYPDAG